MIASGSHHGSRRWLLPVLTTTLVATVGCTAAASPSASSSVASPAAASAPPSLALAVAPSQAASPSAAALATPSANPSPSGVPTVGLAPAGPWKTVGWLDAGSAFPLTAPAGSDTYLLDVYGWSGGYVAFAGNAGNSSSPKPATLQTSSSTDGVHWSAAKPISLSGLGDEIEIAHLAESPGGLVAVGEYPPGTCGGPDTFAGFWHSTDGTTWTRVRQPAAMAAAAISSLNGGPSGFIATGRRADDTSVVWLSANGTDWHPARLPTVTSGKLVVDGGYSVPGGLVLAGAIVGPPGCGGISEIHPAVWWSADGTSWTRESLANASSAPDATLWMRTLANGGLIAVEEAGNGPNRSWMSSDGKSWQPTTPKPDNLPFSVITDGLHAIAPEEPADNSGPFTVTGVADDLTATTLTQTGVTPTEGDATPSWIFAVGPTGLLAVTPDGTSVRVGVPGA